MNDPRSHVGINLLIYIIPLKENVVIEMLMKIFLIF